MKMNIDKDVIIRTCESCVEKLTDVGADLIFQVRNMIDTCVEEARMKEIYAVLGKKYYTMRGDIPDEELSELCRAARLTEQKIASLKEEKLINQLYNKLYNK
ncbi:MAG: hypothetical protein E7665_06350 [Ruminococcaceae bacterium]|nr:hypothetical protein [Oscillospiraceae bacterium]